MAVTVHFNGDSRKLRAAADKAQARVNRFEKQTVGSLKRVNDRGLKVLGSGFISVAAGAAALTTAVRKSADLKSLELGLRSAADETVDLTAHINDLKAAAKNPGLGFEEALKGSIKLQAVDFSAAKATRTLKEFGNVVALSGGGAPELDRITTQLGQLSSKGKVLSQDLRPIIEAAPAVSKALKQAFGTVAADDINAQVKDSTEFINILLDSLGQLPRALETPKSKFQNLADASTRALAKVGDPIVEGIIPALDGLVDTLDGSDEGLKAFGEALGGTLDFLVQVSPALVKFGAAYLAFKVAQKGVNLASSILKGVESVKQSVLVTHQETAAIKANTVAQRANAAARGAGAGSGVSGRNFKSFRKQGLNADFSLALAKGLETKGKASGTVFSKAFLKGAAGKMSGGAGGLAVGFGGAMLTQMIPEGARIGGSTGTSVIDGLSGVLALGGPKGMLAALGLQLVKGAYAIGKSIGDVIERGIDEKFKKSFDVAATVILNEDVKLAIDAGDKSAALAELARQQRQNQKIVEEGNSRARGFAKQNLQSIKLYISELDTLIAKRKEEQAAVRQVAEVDLVKRKEISKGMRLELELQQALLDGDRGRAGALEIAIEHAKELAKVRVEAPELSAGEQDDLALERVILSKDLAALKKREKDDEQALSDKSAKRLELQESIKQLQKDAVATARSGLSDAEKLNNLLARRAYLEKEGGAQGAKAVFKQVRGVKESGDLVRAEKLLKIGVALQGLAKEEEQLRANLQRVADAEKVYDLERSILAARASGASGAEEVAVRQLAVLSKAVEIENVLSVSRKDALRIAENTVTAEEKALALKRQQATSGSRRDFAQQLEVLELQAQGRNKEADALRAKNDLVARAKGLQESLNVSAEKALSLAEREMQAKDAINQGKVLGAGESNIKKSSSSFGRSPSLFDDVSKRSRLGRDGGLRLGVDAKRKGAKDLSALAQVKSEGDAARSTAENTEQMVEIFRGLGAI